jgi:N4-gp56 family major capsid protein
MAEIGVTEISATSMDVVSQLVQETLKQRSILLPTITDYSRFAIKGAKQVDVPRRDQFAAADKTENTALTAQELTFSVDNIALTKYKAILASLEDIARMQATPDVEAEIVQEMANELALQVDKDIIVQLQAASAAAPDHRVATAVAGAIAQGDLLEARRLLSVQNVPLADRFLIIPPDMEKSMLLIADFVRADSYGSPAGLREAELGRIYGMTVMVHNSVAVDEALVYHKGAVGYAAQMTARFDRDRDVDKLADKFALSWLYGVNVLDSGKRQVLLNNDGL